MSSWQASNRIRFVKARLWCRRPQVYSQVIHERTYDMPIELYDSRQRRFLNHSTVVWNFTEFTPPGFVS